MFVFALIRNEVVPLETIDTCCSPTPVLVFLDDQIIAAITVCFSLSRKEGSKGNSDGEE